MRRRSKRLREAGEQYEPPSMSERNSLLERLDDNLFGLVLQMLDLPDLVLLMQVSKFLRFRITRWRGLTPLKRRFAAEARGWTYSGMGDEAAASRVEALVRKGEHCLSCGCKCKGTHVPSVFREKGCRVLTKMCVDCFLAKNPGAKLVKASAADKKFGLSPASRKDLPFVVWNRGYRSLRHMYLESDLRDLAAKLQKSRKR
jgi:hypothetical protein